MSTLAEAAQAERNAEIRRARELLFGELRVECARLTALLAQRNTLTPCTPDAFVQDARIDAAEGQCRALGKRLMQMNVLLECEVEGVEAAAKAIAEVTPEP